MPEAERLGGMHPTLSRQGLVVLPPSIASGAGGRRPGSFRPSQAKDNSDTSGGAQRRGGARRHHQDLLARPGLPVGNPKQVLCRCRGGDAALCRKSADATAERPWHDVQRSIIPPCSAAPRGCALRRPRRIATAMMQRVDAVIIVLGRASSRANAALIARSGRNSA